MSVSLSITIFTYFSITYIEYRALQVRSLPADGSLIVNRIWATLGKSQAGERRSILVSVATTQELRQPFQNPRSEQRYPVATTEAPAV